MALRAGRDARSWAKVLLPSPENCSLRRLGDHSASSSSALPGLASSENTKTNRVARESDEFISQLEISSLYQKRTDFLDKKSV